MEILEVGIKEYSEVIKIPFNVFGTAEFNNLNKDKCKQVYYLLFREGKYRLGIIGGSREGCFYSPFSAPFGGFSFLSEDLRLQYIEEAIKLLKTWAIEKEFSSINITIPPMIYGGNFVSKQFNCLWREGFMISEVNLNYSFELDSFNESYPQRIWHNARKNLRISLTEGFNFEFCTSNEEKNLAYNIIQMNRASKGFPLRMTWPMVKETAQLISADFFIVYKEKSIPVASAIVFHISEFVIQIIYWGDAPGYSELKPMNFLAFKVFEYYKNSNKRIIDIGPSTENSIPNYGLCEFKEGIGCRIDPKYTFIHKLH